MRISSAVAWYRNCLLYLIGLKRTRNMSLFNHPPDDLDEVDVIIAGGGTAGCVFAARLSDASPSLSILVVEGGRNNRDDPSIVHPALFLSGIAPTSDKTLFYKGSEEPSLANRAMVVPSGGVLGGGSSINLLTYSRAQRSDLDAWGAPGWSAEELIPFMKKLETYHGPGDAATHGDDGPLHITSGTFTESRSKDDFIHAAGKLGWPLSPDLQSVNGSACPGAVQANLRYIGQDGTRQDAAHRYLHPRIEDGMHPNLRVLVEHQVVRVLFNESKTAVGIECQRDARFLQGAAPTNPLTVKARRLVVVSCGALGTPLVLERSGVGDPAVLARAGVPLVADVPGVGRNYMDHHVLACPYRSSLNPEETLDALYAGRIDMGAFMASKDPRLGWNAADVTSKIRPSEADVDAMGTNFRETWDRDFKDEPDRPVAIITSLNCFPGDPSALPVAQFMSASSFTVYPYSRGHIHITGRRTTDEPDFQTGFLADLQGVDVKMSMWAYKKQREIVRRMAVYRGEWAPGHPPFALDSAAACVERDGPLVPAAGEVKNIKYTAEDDAVLERWVREHVQTTWHSMGTCKMAPREDVGVVDPSLSVYGVTGLKVVDLSIPPSNIAANTGSAAFMVGEKAADLIIKELGI
ncbi:glucose-methanol-choline (gmc) oxidoreductase [Purpureocillium lavendulum]|uniref:Glucose-methanol-choline (Gmc) oxidoreductase n=1 Tax=Purpureocillium lavendulum TaxID=1247861 RepID=A0AB34FDM8_9HYPO|nr:glucose-methanol-choline (gmc) oxidoreductase [Purpureocillium lavendulum]